MNDFIKMCDCPEVQALQNGYRVNDQFAQIVDKDEGIRGIWLPRLDQIIAMLPGGWGWGPIREFLLHWDVGVRRDFKIYSYTGPTFEHAALQAVMYARHGKRWDAERKVWS